MDVQEFHYECEGTEHHGRLVNPGGEGRPGVLVCHAWGGLDDFAVNVAKKYAAKGYVAMAVDMFGEGKTGNTVEEKSALITPLVQDRGLLQKRIVAAFDKVKTCPEVNGAKVAAVGFCFGGMTALDLARSGVDLRGVLAFHALLDPSGLPPGKIKASILALHGHDDPMVPPEKVLAFEKEMTEGGADWQLLAYGNTVHAFTNPEANDPKLGTIYNEQTAGRAWKVGDLFLEEIFA
ncbi:MAG: dienelactone hydrolase family protein [bacterium]|nr:dienelactone hydrolase family protein [bacterium]